MKSLRPIAQLHVRTAVLCHHEYNLETFLAAHYAFKWNHYANDAIITAEEISQIIPLFLVCSLFFIMFYNNTQLKLYSKKRGANIALFINCFLFFFFGLSPN